jgi:hypothetical protein
MLRSERFIRALVAFVIGILLAALLIRITPYVLDARQKVLQSIRAVFKGSGN